MGVENLDIKVTNTSGRKKEQKKKKKREASSDLEPSENKGDAEISRINVENLELKATDASGRKKKEKKNNKKREASSDLDLVTSGNLIAAEISWINVENLELKATDASGRKKKEKKNKKREASSDLDLVTSGNLIDAEAADELCVDDGMDEPTMGEKLASLNIVDDVTKRPEIEKSSSPSVKPPSADSVHVLLKQALHAEDGILLLDCLYTQDEKVIGNSVSLLNPSDVLKLLDSLISIIQSRGAVLACALPWLRSLLLQHASGIMSQESSLLALNSLYQLIESRVSTFQSALQLSSCLDYNFVGITDDMGDEMSTITPVIYEDKDESDEDAQESEEDVAVNGFSDEEGSDAMTE